MMYQAADLEAKPQSVPPYATTGFPVTYHHNVTTAPPPTAPYSSSTTTTGSYQAAPPPKPLEEWSSGLCDCCSNVNNCCITCWCPCVTFGQVAEIVDKGSTSCGASGALYTLICCVIGCGCLYSCFYRSKLRRQHNLKGSHCADCLVHCCCEPCALSQEYRELQNRGFDMLIGWHGNVEQRTRGIAMTMTAAPPPEHPMTR